MSIQSIQPKLTASERLLLAAAQATSREICRTLVSMWAEGVLVLRDSATLSNSNSLTPKWRADVEQLIDWLGWAVWVKCRPVCAFDVRVVVLSRSFKKIILIAAMQELCYLPAAPFSRDDWNMSRPRCVRVFEPYTAFGEDGLRWGSPKS
jgi:hypothetical protein